MVVFVVVVAVKIVRERDKKNVSSNYRSDHLRFFRIFVCCCCCCCRIANEKPSINSGNKDLLVLRSPVATSAKYR